MWPYIPIRPPFLIDVYLDANLVTHPPMVTELLLYHLIEILSLMVMIELAKSKMRQISAGLE